MPLFMPPSTTIHYKCAFNIKSDNPTLSTQLRKIVRMWCQSRGDIDSFGKQELSRSWFFLGDADQHICGACYVRTASNQGTYETLNPEHWAFELIHADQQTPLRLWSVNIGTARVDATTIRFACLLHYGMKAGYIGPQPQTPLPSVPKFIRDILENENFECFKFQNKINPALYDVAIFGGKWIAEQVCDTQRRLPILIYVHGLNGEISIDIEELFKKNIGNANFYVISDSDNLSYFNANVPYDHRLSLGMMRIYFRYADSPDTGFRHKFYLENDLQSNSKNIAQEVTFALSQNALSFMPGELTKIDQVIEKRRLSKIFEMRKQNDSRDNAEYIKMLETELDEKIQEVSSKDKDLTLTELALEEANEEVKSLSWKANQYSICIQDKAILEKQLSEACKEFDIPRSLHDVLSLAKDYWSNTIFIHEAAYRSAEKYGSAGDIRIVQEAWKMLNKLALIMYSLKFFEQSNELETAFRNSTGIDFSMTESKMTKRDKNFVKLRTCDWKNTKITFFPHLKSTIRDDFRLHFAFLEAEKKILICHCGEHLDNAKTRHIE